MIFYHGTSEEKWTLIQEECKLWGYNIYQDESGNPYKSYRYTYLTPNIEIAKQFGDVILEVEYNPVGVDGTKTDNYGFNPPKGEYCWQFSVFIPISLKNIKRIK
jgi:hypothetical protein